MRRCFWVLFLVIGVVPTAAAERPVWVVQPGDTLSGIASRFRTNVGAIQHWNALSTTVIHPGQSLYVADPPREYVVARGDNLTKIARSNGTTVEAIVAGNVGLNAHRLSIGQKLVLPGQSNHATTPELPEVKYTVRAGDSLTAIARRREVSVREIRQWNSNLRGNMLRPGQTLVLHTDIPESTSESIGSPARGRLLHAHRLQRHAGMVIRNPDRSWGTMETVRWIRQAIDSMTEAGEKRRLRVHDLSLRHGGPMHDHLSHQSGRDVDITFYQKHCARRECAFRVVSPRTLDADAEWRLLKHWLAADQIEAIFIDYSLQKPLYEAAKRDGASSRQLWRWFQYPKGRTHVDGLVRHYPKHKDHAHVRFVCPDTDTKCQ